MNCPLCNIECSINKTLYHKYYYCNNSVCININTFGSPMYYTIGFFNSNNNSFFERIPINDNTMLVYNVDLLPDNKYHLFSYGKNNCGEDILILEKDNVEKMINKVKLLLPFL